MSFDRVYGFVKSKVERVKEKKVSYFQENNTGISSERSLNIYCK
jgi:hypothetical protein